MASSFLDIKKTLPALGVGLGLRRELAKSTFDCQHSIDWLELVPENYMGLGGKSRQLLEEAADRFPLVSHGINLSIGSTDDLNQDYLKSLKTLLDTIDAPWWSDHLCFTSVDGVYMQDLLPLPFSRAAVRHIAERAKRVQDFLERPFLLENISFYMSMPGCEMSEAQFLAEVLESADCGLLLDVNNIYVNSLNHGYDPVKFLDQIPLERTVQVHIAGHKRTRETVIDTHGAPVVQPVYELFEQALARVEVKAVMLERDQNFPDFGEILDELKTIGEIARRVQPALTATGSKCGSTQGDHRARTDRSKQQSDQGAANSEEAVHDHALSA